MRLLLLLTLIGSALAAPAYEHSVADEGLLARSGCSCDSEQIAVQKKRAAAVKEAFEFAWDGYFTYAFPNDELHPVSNTYGNSRNGWGASAADALSTAIIMRNATIVDVILNHLATVDYTQTSTTCSLFETTIRYLAGMLSGYDLLKGPFANLTTNSSSNVEALVSQSVTLANTLKFAFNTTTGIPYNDLNIDPQTVADSSPTNDLATIGSLVLEWTHLSDLTGNPLYANLSQTGESYLLHPQPSWAEPFPGLVGSNVNITSGEFLDATGGWVGGADSFYEYLLKMYVYDQSRFGEYKTRWMAAADSTIQYLASHPSTKPNITYLAEFSNTSTIETSEHLACFDGGNFILGGLVLGQQNYTDFGLALVEGCRNTYASTATGIGPEVFSWDNSSVPSGDESFWEAHGFYITDSIYDLRPEYLESLYYAYRATGQQKYQEWSWEAFQAINASTRTGSGFSEINDVNTVGGGSKGDLQESFLFAEVMKYAYVIHDVDGPFQVNYQGQERFVFNTEAHPFKVAGTPLQTTAMSGYSNQKAGCSCGSSSSSSSSSY